MANFKKLQACRYWEPHCLCGKSIYYSWTAAEFALRQTIARRIIQCGEPLETEIYECPEVWGAGVYHLTSSRTHAEKARLEGLRKERKEFLK